VPAWIMTVGAGTGVSAGGAMMAVGCETGCTAGGPTVAAGTGVYCGTTGADLIRPAAFRDGSAVAGPCSGNPPLPLGCAVGAVDALGGEPPADVVDPFTP